jgi:dTDP-4-amino-4,6-dideoxygalactose transaminase
MSIFNPPPLSRQRIYTAPFHYLTILQDILTKRVHKGGDVERLEGEISRMTGSKYAICTPQGRIGIYLSIKAILRDTDNRDIVMSPYTIFDVVNVVIAAGGKPIFADIEKDTCNIDPSEIELLTNNKTAAVLVTHLHGKSCDMKRIMNICNAKSIPVIEDAAQSFGVVYNENMLGSVGLCGIYSFGMMKNINGLNGGCVVTSDNKIADFIRNEIRQYAQIKPTLLLKRALYGSLLSFATSPIIFKISTFWIFRYGFLNNIGPINMLSRSEQNPILKENISSAQKVRLSSLQARLVLKQLTVVDKYSNIRIQKAKVYADNLIEVKNISYPKYTNNMSNTYMSFPIHVNNKHKLLCYLMRNNRDIAAQHLKNCSELDIFKDYYKDCKNAKRTSESLILLPTYHNYKELDIERNISIIRKYFAVFGDK